MLGTSARHRIKVLLGTGQPKVEVAWLMGVSLRTVQRIDKERDVVPGDDVAERRRRRIGRPSIVANYRELILKLLETRPDMKSIEIVDRVRTKGYRGSKTTMYAFTAHLRSLTSRRPKDRRRG